MAFVRQAVLLVALVAACWAHPDGAPESACATMIPEHKDAVGEVAGPATPFKLVQDKRDFKAGDVVAVTLSSSGTPFKGFFVKAFDEKNQEIGQFEASPEAKAVTKCSGVTHTGNAPKTAVKVLWKAPAGATGKVHFRATVVIDYHKHVSGLQSTVA
ncbi:defense protein l(2)34Fc-like [Dermacentor andersoni]|uniref:defense protein l(2)34Fc-like n=1 Tax=Dermacentor andersoni TaxID=34620 RepID=UPI002155689A|nr:defense protein l(2)34Fc-like [Dermacentor andersoni]